MVNVSAKTIVISVNRVQQQPNSVNFDYIAQANVTTADSDTLEAPSSQEVRIQIALLMGGFGCHPDLCTNTKVL